MEDKNQKAQRDILGLQRWANSLLDLANAITQDASYSEDDHFAFMTSSYISKQKTHIKSIHALTESRDSGLIARAMLEGMWQLLWADLDPTTRSLKWRAFAWILDWRFMQAQIKAGEQIDSSKRVTIEQALKQYGDMFLTSKARKAKQSGNPMPNDPYSKDWTGHSIKEIIEEVGGQELYLRLYKSFSAWQH